MRDKHVTWIRFKRHRNHQNGIDFRRACALVKRESKSAKRLTWENFLNSLNPMLDVRTLWMRVKTIRTERRHQFPTIIDNDVVIDHPLDIANKFKKNSIFS